MGKTNFKYLIIGHLTGIVLLGILLFVVGEDHRYIIKLIMAALAGSIIAQLIMYKKKPKWFTDKTKNHSGLP